MKQTLSKNISRLRRERGLTQEQLAEALGVSFAAVSKWERGAATPELGTMLELADLFGLSLDALVGYRAQDGSVTALEERIRSLQREKRFDEAIVEAEKALLRYPNDLRVVRCCGELYYFSGLERSNKDDCRRSIALLQRAIPLLSQNDDPKFSELSLQKQIALGYLTLGQTEKGLALLKKTNSGGINNDIIALNCSIDHERDPHEAEPYLMEAFVDMIAWAAHSMMAYANYYDRLGDHIASREALLWLIDLLESVKQNRDGVAFVDKTLALCLVQCAVLSWKLGEEPEHYLRRAHQLARCFDAAPTCGMDNIRFCVGDTQKTRAYDDMGTSLRAGMEQQLRGDGEEPLLALWQRLDREAEA